ncbi:putative T7SS-secreted protein [Streptomyces sp. NPDC048603]|uniref:putative T7SS-secreted protein n=1 Tax=Streptomyces sp. NPDC048603 TaxID=3365577 RepID=UPI00371E0213
MGWRDWTPDFIEDAGEDAVEGIGDGVEWLGDKTADLAEDVGWDDGADWIREKSRSLANTMGAEVAEMELDQTEDPKKIIYGSVSKIRENAKHLTDFRTNFDKVGNGIKGLRADAIKGVTADSYAEHTAKQPPKWFKAADAFEKAEGALTRFAETVEWAQNEARDAIEAYKKAKKASEDARTAYNAKVDEYNDAVKAKKDDLPPRPSGFKDPGEAGITAAYDKVINARKQRNEAAETAKTALTAARDAAPPKPSYAEQVKDGLQGLEIDARHLGGGLIKGTAGLLNFVRAVNPTDPYNITHPAEYLTNLNNTVTGLAVAANDPVGTAKNMLDEFMKDPSEGIGKLIPELVGTKGLGAAKKAATIAKHADDLKGPGRKQTDGDGPDGPARCGTDKVCDGDPVDVATGRMLLPQTDLALPGSLPLVFERTFESSYRAGRWFGPNWASTIDQRLEIDPEGIVLVREDGGIQLYPHPAPGVPVLPTHGRRWPLDRSPDGGYTVTDPDHGTVRRFGATASAGTGTAGAGGEADGDGVALLEEITDRNGVALTFEHDEDGVPLGITHSGGYRVRFETADGRVTGLTLADGPRVLTYSYTGGNLTEVVNSSGKPLRFGYDDQGRVTSWTDTNGHRFDYVYDDADRCVSQAGTNGHMTTAFVYEDGVTTVTDACGRRRRYEVNTRSQVVADIDSRGAATRYTYDRYNQLLALTDPLGHVTTCRYDENGRLLGITRPDGRTTTAEYDLLGLPTRVVRPDGTVVRQTFDERGNRLSETAPSGARTLFGYDDRGHLSSVTDALGHTTTYRCDAAGRPVEISDPLGAVTRYAYDAFGRPVTVTGPLGETTRLEWTPEGRLTRRTDPDGAESVWTYDGEGNLLVHRDPAGGATTYEYGDFDLLLARTDPDGARHRFAHYPDLRLKEVTNPQGLTWSYTYDHAGRMVSETDFDGRTLTRTYDAAGRLESRTNALGQTVRFERNALGQVVRKDAAGRATTYEYDVSDELARAVGPDATLTWLRDRNGLLRSETVNGRELRFEHDALGRRTRRTTPGRAVSAWEYDAAGNRTRLTASGRELRFEHDAAGRETVRSFGGTAAFGSTWDPVGRLTGQSVTADGRTVRRRDYRYDAAGSLTGIEGTGGAPSRSFRLDPVGRVTDVDGKGWTERYVYDTAGNLASVRRPALHGDMAATDADHTYEGNRVVGAGAFRYAHDVQGRVVQRTRKRLSRKADSWHYTWDAEDRLTQVVTPDGTTWRYTYDPLGRRLSKQRLAADGAVAEETLFTWDGHTLCEQSTRTPDRPHEVVLTWDHRGLHPLAQTERVLDASREEVDSRFFGIVTDLVGTPTELVDEAGTVAWQTRSSLWGTTGWNSDATAYTPLRFPGQYFDPETGLHYNVHRHYDPETARYLSVDPLGLDPAPNPRAYVDNPHLWADPLGLKPCKVKVSPVASDWATKGAHIHVGADEVRISVNKDGELVGEPIRLKATGWASDKSVKTAVEAVENDPKLRADLLAKAKSAKEHMEDHNWGNTQNRKDEMQALIDKLENWP